MVDTAIANQINPGEVIDHDVIVSAMPFPGGGRPELTIVVVGYDGTAPIHVGTSRTLPTPYDRERHTLPHAPAQ
ncbi:hypothetical protein OHA77_33555 [Streptosporangium sp. NBC_01639]|uniref:hypothetical protein n=1 Tax=Streptosporangium sp. NBC_01639 TaxID=2975948 RepID=UPI0038670494|nr:hypothetical protein OHA77_33555 [Streptosporangium sp. NBC_01639]